MDTNETKMDAQAAPPADTDLTEKNVSEDAKGLRASRRLSFALKVAALVAVVLAVYFLGMMSGIYRGADSQSGSTSLPAAQEQAKEGTGGSDDAASAACDHLWVPEYGSVHHDAVYEQVWHDPVYETETTYHTVCNDCQAVIDGTAAQHIADTGHSGYSTNVPIANEVIVQEGYYEDVLTEEAYDETVQTGYICASCGEHKALEGAEA